MITKELLEKAINTSHDSCEPSCKHADAFEGAIEMVKEDLVSMIIREIRIRVKARRISGNNFVEALVETTDFAEMGPFLEKVYFNAVHIGYRLKELELEEETEEQFGKKAEAAATPAD